MPILLSIHDVAVPFERQLRELWSLCSGAGACPTLVVRAAAHGASLPEAGSRFTDWLYARTDQGARVFVRAELRAQHAEHAHEDAALIARTVLGLNRCGIVPAGLILSTARASHEARTLARTQGFSVLEDSRFVWSLGSGVVVSAPIVRVRAFLKPDGEKAAAALDAASGDMAIRMRFRPSHVDDRSGIAAVTRLLEGAGRRLGFGSHAAAVAGGAEQGRSAA